MTEAKLAICICTMDRPDLLRRCLASITEGVQLPNQIIVSDDSKDPTETQRVCNKVPNVTYLEGPRRGLCANRNFVVRHVEANYVSLLDDDAMVSKEFVKDALGMILKFPDRTILTGVVREAGDEIFPSNLRFLGYFGKLPGKKLKNINLNCNVFPRQAFLMAQFDEAIKYGYEDADLCACLLCHGFHIEFVPSLCNEHAPPPRTSAQRVPLLASSQRARYYTSVKRYLIWDKNIFFLVTYIIWATLHRWMCAIRKMDWKDLQYNVIDMHAAVILAWKEKRRLSKTQ